jgi:hypothetical protein
MHWSLLHTNALGRGRMTSTFRVLSAEPAQPPEAMAKARPDRDTAIRISPR